MFFRTSEICFSKENWGKSYNRVLGGGYESDGRGYQILLGDCHTITISSGSSSIGKVEGRTFKQSRLEELTYGRTTFDTTNSGGSKTLNPPVYLIRFLEGKKSSSFNSLLNPDDSPSYLLLLQSLSTKQSQQNLQILGSFVQIPPA